MAEPQAEQPGNGGSSSGSSSLKTEAPPPEEMAAAEEEPAKADEGEGEPAAASVAAQEAAGSWEEHECRICYNRFDAERRAPKLLACLHTFCQECLAQLHLRAVLAAHSPSRGAAEGGGGYPHGAAAAITCPLCRHRTALPDCSVQGLPVNTKLWQRIPPRAAWSAPAPSLHQTLRLLQAPRAAQQRPLSERGSSGAAPSATDAARDAQAQHCAGGLGGGCGGCSESDQSWRRKAVNLGCLCVVFCVLSMLLLFFAWMNWLTGSIFIGVAVLLLFFATMPFAKYGFRNRSGAAAAVALLAPAGTNGPGGAAACSVTPRSRPAADRRTRS